MRERTVGAALVGAARCSVHFPL